MSYNSEQDPLLPKDKGAPEIHGSRPSSFKDVTVSAEELEAATDTEDQPRRAFNDALGMFVILLCFLLALGLYFFPDDVFDGFEPGPRTIEERVKDILTNTPLIGKLPHFYV